MNKSPRLKKLTFLALFLALSQSGWSEEIKYLETGLVAEGIDGRVVDAKNKKPISDAMVSVAWVLQPKKDSTLTKQPIRMGVIQSYTESNGTFRIAGWQQRQPETARNWEIMPGKDPIVRIYAKGYQRLIIDNFKIGKGKIRRPYNPAHAAVLKWIGQGKTQRMKALPVGEAALAKELRLWRKDLDEEIQAVSIGRDKAHALASQREILLLFNDQCKSLSDEIRRQICYPPDSEVVQYLEEDTKIRSRNIVYERPDGEQEMIPFQVGQPPAMGGAQSPMQGGAASPKVRLPARATEQEK